MSTNNATATSVAEIDVAVLTLNKMHIYKAAHLTHSLALGRVSILLISEPGAIISQPTNKKKQSTTMYSENLDIILHNS